MATKRLLQPLRLTKVGRSWRLDRKTPTSSSGISLEKQACIGAEEIMSLCFVILFLDSLRGHRDQITAIQFLCIVQNRPSTSTAVAPGLLLTSSKDTFLKLWDLSTQHCIQTTVAHRSEIWSMVIHQARDLVFTGSGEGALKVWKVDREALAQGLKETETGEVPG